MGPRPEAVVITIGARPIKEQGDQDAAERADMQGMKCELSEGGVIAALTPASFKSALPKEDGRLSG